MGFLTFLALVGLAWWLAGTRKRLRELEHGVEEDAARRAELSGQIRRIERRLDALADLAGSIGAPPAVAQSPAVEDLPHAEPEPILTPTAPGSPAAPPGPGIPQPDVIPALPRRADRIVREPPRPVAAQPPSPPEPTPSQLWWARLERQLIENWTGILGTAVLVAGITFLGGYAGLRLSPFYRVLMIVAAAAALAGGSWWLRGREKWMPLAQWLRSAAAAVFLFACFASSAIPGLRWVTTLAPALGILVLGIAANLAVAHAAGAATFASLHVVLSLIPITLVPPSAVSLVLATLVAAAGIALALRGRWDLHTLITLVAFAAFQLRWYVVAFTPAPSVAGRLLGAGSALLVGAMAALTHYRKTSDSPGLKTLPLLVHLGSWTLLSVAVGTYAGQTVWRGVALIAAGVLVWFLGRHARALGLRWLYLTDSLAGRALALVGAVSFYPFVTHWLLVPAVIFLQAMLYLKLALDEDEPVLERVGIHLVHAAAAALALAGVLAVSPDPAVRMQNALILLLAAALGTGAHVYLVRKLGETFDSAHLYDTTSSAVPGGPSVLGVGVGVIAAIGLANLYGTRWLAAAGLVATAFLLATWRRSSSSSLGVAGWITLVTTHLLSWYDVVSRHPLPLVSQIGEHLAPLALAGAVAVAWGAGEGVGRSLRHAGIYFIGITTAIGAYTLLQPVSPLVPGVVWLSLSLILVEIANRVGDDDVGPVLHLGYGYLALFAGAYGLVVIQAQTYWGAVPVRALIEAYALAVIAFWWWYRPRAALEQSSSWRAVHPLFLELGLGFLAVVTVLEAAVPWRPLIWGVLALIAAARPLGGAVDPRLRLYSVVLFWTSIYDVVAVTSGFAAPAATWYQGPAFAGVLAIGAQVAYLGTVSRRLALAEIQFPAPLGGIGDWSRIIGARQSFWLYYPFFAGAAAFLYWRFESAVLTLLWSAEAFIVFVLSLVLREGHFRYMALTGLAACVIRLLAYDMAQANLGLRGAVFIGVGLLMLGMNSLYNKYRDRIR